MSDETRKQLDHLISRRNVLGSIGVTGITTVAGCSDSGTQDGNQTDREPGEGSSDGDLEDGSEDQNDNPLTADLDFTHRGFAEKAFIDPEYIIADVIGENSEDLQENYTGRLGFESWNVQNSLDSLSEENARYIIDKTTNVLPWSVFNADPMDMKVDLSDIGIIGHDADRTYSALLDLSLPEALEGLQERGDIDVTGTYDKHIEFESEGHKPEPMEDLEYEDSLLIAGHVVSLENYDGTILSVTRGLHTHPEAEAWPIVEGKNGVQEIADFHFALIEGDRYSILDVDGRIGGVVEHVLNRADGVGEEPASDRVFLRDLEETEEYEEVARSSQIAYQEDGYDSRIYYVYEERDGYSSEEQEDRRLFVPLEEHSHLREE